MPEIKNIFTSGRMNKDLDERLIPKTEYRDALNIDVSTSEGSNVGAIQSSRGNKRGDLINFSNGLSIPGQQCIGSIRHSKEDKIYWFITGTMIDVIAEYDANINEISPVLVDVWQAQQSVASHSSGSATVTLSGANTGIRIGMTVTGTNVPAGITVANISGTTLTLSSVVNAVISGTLTFQADKVLNFNTYNLITGVNIIGGKLFFTDNESEPKCINIEESKAGCTIGSFATHTNFSPSSTVSVPMEEEHITVIKKYPLTAPTLEMANTEDATRMGPSTTQATTGNSIFILGTDIRPIGFTTGYIRFSPVPNYRAGDTIIFTSPKDDLNASGVHTVRVRLLGTPIPDQDAAGTYIRFAAVILSISQDITNQIMTWDTVLQKEDPMFELQFPRFAYRWKYSDGEYSAFSPFSEPAFLPIEDIANNEIYHASDGYNLTMLNDLRNLVLTDFDTRPDGVVEVDILVKQVNDPGVYTIATLKDGGLINELDTVESSGDGFQVQSEQVHAVLPSNQLLRPWDNVPRKALAQEISKNRVVYGNYVQNYNMEDKQPIFNPVIIPEMINEADINDPVPSLKSIRTYQLGVTFLDKYGRQTPVITHDTAVAPLTQIGSNTRNVLRCSISGDSVGTAFTPPSWATHFKYYIKENSSEYYNLALDRFYTSEDGNVWLSFPSSDRNKVDLETYLILKKQHNTDQAAFDDMPEQTLKYKILEIKNTVPSFLKKRKVSLGSVRTTFGVDPTNMTGDRSGYPQEGFLFFHVPGPDIASDASALKDLASDSVSDKYIRVVGGNSASYYYGITSIEQVNAVKLDEDGDSDDDDDDYLDVGDYWVFKLKKPFGADIAFTFDSAGDEVSGLSLEVYQEEDEDNKPEFDGRFFVKVNRDRYIGRYLIANAANPLYAILNEEDFMHIAITQSQMAGARHYFRGLVIGIPMGLSFNEEGFDDVLGQFSIDTGQMVSGVTHNEWGAPTYLGIGTGTSNSNIMELRLTNYGDETKEKPNDTPPPGDFPTVGSYDFNIGLRTNGTLLRWKDDPMSNVYEIIDTPILHAGYNWVKGTGNLRRNQAKHASNKGLRYTITLDRPLAWDPTTTTIPVTDNTPIDVVPSVDVGMLYHKNDNTTNSVTGFANKASAILQIVEEVETGEQHSTTTPAIFETEPKETVDLDIYHETSQAFPIAVIGTEQIFNWFNCYSYGTGLESNRIRDDFNAIFIDKGPKVSTVLAEQYEEEHRASGMIYSGIFNSTSGINRLNQFIAAEQITKDVNPSYGSIQKLYSRDSDLVVLCEDKSLKVLANKDALYNADGNVNLTATSRVLGQTIPFIGDYGISKNPESFASYGFRSYWTDQARGSVIRLSRDGLTNISDKGMRDYFADNFETYSAHGTSDYGVFPGSYDEHKDTYNITLKNNNNSTSGITISYAENVGGWTSRKSFIPQSGLSLNNIYYTFYQGDIWRHVGNKYNLDTAYNSFYGIANGYSSVKFIFNDTPSSIKNFKTLNYEGTKPKQTTYAGTIGGVAYTGLSIDEVVTKQPTLTESDGLTLTTTEGWYCNSITTNEQSGDIQEFKNKEGKWFSNIHNTAITTGDLLTGDAAKEFAIQGIGNVSSFTDPVGVNGGNITIDLTRNTSGATWTHGEAIVLTRASGAISESVQFIITPPEGKVIKASDFGINTESSTPTISGGGITDGSVTVVNNSDADSFGNYGTDNTLTLTLPLSFTYGNGAQAITASINGIESAIKYTINGTYNTDESNTTTTSRTDVPYTATGVAGSTALIEMSSGVNLIAFESDSGYDFATYPPTSSITAEYPGNYNIGVADTITSPLRRRVFTVQYTFPAKSVSGDKIFFVANAQKTIATAVNNLYNYTFDATSVGTNGETRTLSITGDAGAQVIVDAKNASNTSIISGPITLTIPSGAGAAGTITKAISFPPITNSTTYTVTMTETGSNRFEMTNSFNGATGSAGSRIKTLTLNQRIDTTVTFTASTSESDLTIDGNATTSSITSTNQALKEPNPEDEVVLSYVVSSGNNGSITANNATTTYPFTNTRWTGNLSGNIKTLTNGTEVVFRGLKTVMNDNTATITGSAYILKYGTANDTTTMNVDAFLAVVATAPTATAQNVTTQFNTAKVITLAGTDPQGGTNLTFAIASNPSNGTLSAITDPGSGLTATVTYTPTTGIAGSDSFAFTVNDGTTTSSAATVAITVSGQAYAWVVDNRGTSDANAACNQPWGTGGQLETVYANTNVPTNGMRFYTDQALTVTYNPQTNGTSNAPNDSHRFDLGSAGSNCGYHGIIGSTGLVNIIQPCCPE